MSDQRPAVESDRRALEGLIANELAGTAYGAVPAYFLRLALEGRTAEARAFVAEHGGEVVGCAIVGEVAGSVGTGRIHFIGASAAGKAAAVDAMLCHAAVRDLTDRGARVIIAELADDIALASYRALLVRSAFVEVGRVHEYYRDGVDLIILANHVTDQPSAAASG